MDLKFKFLSKIPGPLKNKYLITFIVFLFWMTFLDSYNILNLRELYIEEKKLNEEKEFYINEIRKDSVELYKLTNDKKYQEKFARERYLMRKKNEDVYIIKEQRK